MIVERSTDYAYFRDVLARPGMRRAASANAEVDDSMLEQALRNPDAAYFVVREDSRRLGFVVFLMRAPTVAELHTCLLTLGQRTREAVRLAIAGVCREGAQMIVAAYPSANRAADRMLVDVGFSDSPELAQLYPESVRATYKFKELPCHG